jgi:hypothetical protein
MNRGLKYVYMQCSPVCCRALLLESSSVHSDGRSVMDYWWNDTDRGKLKYWEKKHYTAWMVDGWMGMEQWWNDSDRGN